MAPDLLMSMIGVICLDSDPVIQHGHAKMGEAQLEESIQMIGHRIWSVTGNRSALPRHLRDSVVKTKVQHTLGDERVTCDSSVLARRFSLDGAYLRTLFFIRIQPNSPIPSRSIPYSVGPISSQDVTMKLRYHPR